MYACPVTANVFRFPSAYSVIHREIWNSIFLHGSVEFTRPSRTIVSFVRFQATRSDSTWALFHKCAPVGAVRSSNLTLLCGFQPMVLTFRAGTFWTIFTPLVGIRQSPHRFSSEGALLGENIDKNTNTRFTRVRRSPRPAEGDTLLSAVAQFISRHTGEAAKAWPRERKIACITSRSVSSTTSAIV